MINQGSGRDLYRFSHLRTSQHQVVFVQLECFSVIVIVGHCRGNSRDVKYKNKNDWGLYTAMSLSNQDCSSRDTATGRPWRKGNVNCDNSNFFSKGCFGDLLAVGSDIETLELQKYKIEISDTYVYIYPFCCTKATVKDRQANGKG